MHEQALHFEIMLNKMNPEILKERLGVMKEEERAEFLLNGD
jgi:hypothetical protein